jgi:23S rRNA (uracil1939-C5)-methyltransferase
VKVRAFDQFAHTMHVETVCLLSKLHGAKHHVNVTLDMDELDITSAENKATYEEIKEYVLEKHGLQVTNLYIAQVKRKCGIIERENYNIRKATRRMDGLQDDSTSAANLENGNSQGKSQKEDAKQPQCPEDKEKAIMDALEHFGMI